MKKNKKWSKLLCFFFKLIVSVAIPSIEELINPFDADKDFSASSRYNINKNFYVFQFSVI